MTHDQPPAREKMSEDEIFKDFPKWWFIAGGGIHAAFKDQSLIRLRYFAEQLPKIAWETAYKIATDQERAKTEQLYEKMAHEYTELEADYYAVKKKIQELENKLAVAVEALRPFAAALRDRKNEDLLKSSEWCPRFSGKDFVNARQALSEIKGGE